MCFQSFLVKAVNKYTIWSLEQFTDWKGGTSGHKEHLHCYFNPVGVGGIGGSRDVKQEDCQIVAASSRFCKQHIKVVLPLHFIIPQISALYRTHTSSGSISLLPASLRQTTRCSWATQVHVVSSDTSLWLSRPCRTQTLPFQFSVFFLLFLLHFLSAVSRDGMKKWGAEEEIIVCLCGAKQRDWQMDSPRDAQRR